MSYMKKVLLINGPNLNLLGKREPHIYGTETISDVVDDLKVQAHKWNIELTDFQSNSESEIIDKIHSVLDNKVDYIVINAGAFTHTSIAIRDALAAVKIKFIEVHLSNTKARETFRKHSYLTDIASGVIEGFGKNSYYLALYSIFINSDDKE